MAVRRDRRHISSVSGYLRDFMRGSKKMTKADDQRLAALIKKNAAKAEKPKTPRRRQFDDTLRPETEEDYDARKFFSEMKRREVDNQGY